jgi:hypothetical protein
MIEEHWHNIHQQIGSNATFFVRDRVAVTLYYLMHAGSVGDAAKAFGMSKASASRYIWQVIRVIIKFLGPIYVKLPDSVSQWQQIIDGFEEICGFPNCCFAIDGCLFEIERPYDFEGWYCRKGYPAINAQVVVDHQTRILSYDLRPGSANDKSIFNYSNFGQTVDEVLPPGKYGVADAGYCLTNRMLTPFPIEECMEESESLYNYLHSKTRITVERCFGSLKNRFRIFKSPLGQRAAPNSEDTQISRNSMIIEACFILHNILISLRDNFNSEIDAERNEDDDPLIDDNENANSVTSSGVLVRDQVKRYLAINREYLQQF